MLAKPMPIRTMPPMTLRIIVSQRRPKFLDDSPLVFIRSWTTLRLDNASATNPKKKNPAI